MYYVYVLKSQKDEGLYIGFTSHLKNRVTAHQKGFNKATKHRLPVMLIYYEAFMSNTDARSRETYLKSGYGRQQLYNILKRTLDS